MALWIIITGFLVGLLVGLTGMGGALLMTPLLILIYGFSPTMAVGTDLVYAAVTKAAGALQHFKQKTVDWDVVKKLALGSIPGGIIGVILIGFLHQSPAFSFDLILKKFLGIIFILFAVMMLVRLLWTREKAEGKLVKNRSLKRVGFLGGLLVGITSVGSGSLFILFLMSRTSLSAALLVGTDVVHAFFLTLSTGMLHATFGNVDWVFVSYLLMGSIPGILLGGRLTLHVPDKLLRGFIICILLATGVMML
ncbi:sulfite exporter TauE/SafE family protein [Mechercharimyces sp. CAU 1602]|nr:sulfite exporter TauE/SafE family protein [Mechercharimyces sp. CAU 1602]